MYSTSLPKNVTFKKYALLAESLTIITTPVFLTTSDPSLPQLVIVKTSNSIYLLEISHLFSCSLVQELIHLYISARVALTIAHWSPSKVWSADNSSEDWNIEVGGGGWGFWRLNDNFRSDILPCEKYAALCKITVTQRLWCFLLILCDTAYSTCLQWDLLRVKDSYQEEEASQLFHTCDANNSNIYCKFRIFCKKSWILEKSVDELDICWQGVYLDPWQD